MGLRARAGFFAPRRSCPAVPAVPENARAQRGMPKVIAQRLLRVESARCLDVEFLRGKTVENLCIPNALEGVLGVQRDPEAPCLTDWVIFCV